MNNPEKSNLGIAANPILKIKFFGIGGAGCHAADYLASAGFGDMEFHIMDADAKALLSCQIPQKHVLGSSVTRGLGVGGDAELAKSIAEREMERMAKLCEGADVVFIAAGLGGGTGSGAAPILAQGIRDQGILVLVFAIQPFNCEGTKRRTQSEAALQHLKRTADAVICLPNQVLYKMVDEKTSLIETFKASHEFLAQGLQGLWRMLTQPGLIRVDFAHLSATLRGRHAEGTFARVEARGACRAREVMEKLKSHPMLEEGKKLTDASSVLVSIAGGTDLNMAEVRYIMEHVNQLCENAQVSIGATVDQNLADQIEVTLIASAQVMTKSDVGIENAVESGISRNVEHTTDELGLVNGLDSSVEGRPAPRYLPPPPNITPEQAEKLIRQAPIIDPQLKKVIPRLRQGQLPLETVSKGRFQKSEPTIHHGEDLDVPTFKRRGLVFN
jgi:cell division protein FtsZ